ncbi:MAG: glycerol-3-phosphate ABC transporter ATP-binding protein [Gammaproteobacteria bacterium SG8_31]|jgi:multiple sugar transport system ATP-binding protein|nr:MAG: glycerol-3-phosphate ABC transporter ATP-binding protein [Gammaproteobacteria bacterium SG8_31]
MAGIRFDGVAKRFGDVSVLEDLDLDIKDHEFMVFVGPSGCGKSTALRLIAGLEEVTEGELSIGDRVVNNVHPKDRDVAMVFQSYALYPHMSVRENIAFGLRIRKMPDAEIDKLVGEAAEILGLTPLLDRKPKALSGGQRQRVALGRAIVRHPSVFLFDEPLSNLDAELRVQMRAEISKLQHRLKTTTVYVTHDQIEAMTLGHRIAVLAPMGPDRKTNLKQVGTPLELYDKPRNLFVAKFIGTPPMNILGVTADGEGRKLIHPSFEVPLSEVTAGRLVDFRGKELLMGIRPEHIGDASDHRDWETPVHFKGTIEIVETVGHEVIIHVSCGEDMIVAKLGAQRIPTFGEEIELAMRGEALHVFDPQTERSLLT